MADREVGALGRRGDDHLLTPASRCRAALSRSVKSPVLSMTTSTPRSPQGELGRVALGKHPHLGAVDEDVVVVRLDCARVAAEDRVVVEQVGQGRRVGDVVDRDDLEVGLPLRGRAEDVPSDAAEPVDPHAYAHPAPFLAVENERQSTRLPACQAAGWMRRRARPGPRPSPPRPCAGVRRAGAAPPPGPRRGPVDRVVDGDTLVARIDGDRARGCACSASTPPRASAATARPSATAPRPARRRARPAAAGRADRRLRDRPDPGREDRFGRLLAEVTVAGDARTVNEQLVAGGSAEVFRGDGRGRLQPALRAGRARGARSRPRPLGACPQLAT